jgi:uncharacterized protein (DUF58 family)
MRFGTRVAFKSVLAARIAALLAWQVVMAGDCIGGGTWGDARLCQVAPQAREAGALSLLRLLVAGAVAPPASTSLAGLLEMAARVRVGERVIVLSDFHTLDEAALRAVRRVAQHADLVLVQVYDTLEADAPASGCYPVCGADGALVQLDFSRDSVRDALTAPFAARNAALRDLAASAGCAWLQVATHHDPLPVAREALATCGTVRPGWA